MKKNKVLKVNELKDVHDLLVEMARINDKTTFPYDVFVKGGDSYGTGQNEHGDPHFSFKKGDDFDLKIKIPTDWNDNKTLTIIKGDDRNAKKELKKLLVWMDEKNYFDPTRTNLEFIKLQWNVLNADNKNVKKI